MEPTTPQAGTEDPRITAARAAVNGPGPRFDVLLPPAVLTEMYYEMRRTLAGLLEVIDRPPFTRIDDRTVELSDQALLVREIHDLLLDQGYSQGDALILLRGSRAPEGLRSKTP